MSAAWFLLRYGAISALGDTLYQALCKIDVNADSVAQKALMPEFSQAWTRFQKWFEEPELSTAATGSFSQLLGIFDAFQAIASVEADFALKYWYEEERTVQFRLDPPTRLYTRPSWSKLPLDMTNELKRQLETLYGRTVEVIPLPKVQ